MANRSKTPRLPSNKDLVTQQRHTDWSIAHEQGRTRCGRTLTFLVGAHGATSTKAARSAHACRGNAQREW